jgi:hypothetical protein
MPHAATSAPRTSRRPFAIVGVMVVGGIVGAFAAMRRRSL